MLELLKPYHSCSWDFDLTLIDHPMSPVMWEFIRRNPYGQQHSIVTMRSHGIEDEMFFILQCEGSGLTRDNFTHVVNVPDNLYDDYCASRDPHHEYREWKGLICKQIGSEVLIDDMDGTNISKRGCELYGIDHIHPDELI